MENTQSNPTLDAINDEINSEIEKVKAKGQEDLEVELKNINAKQTKVSVLTNSFLQCRHLPTLQILFFGFFHVLFCI